MIITVAGFKGGVGKTTSAVHIGCYLSQHGSTLLVDGDPNRSASAWASRGQLPYRVVDERAAARYAREAEHIVIDTEARPEIDDLRALADGCDLLVVPSTPDVLALEALSQTIGALNEIGSNRYKVLLTIVPPRPSKDGQEAREALQGVPLFRKNIRRFVAYQKAALAGVPVYESPDKNRRIAWRDYEAIGEELLR